MGIKAVSAPILAGEIAFTQWRGSSTLMWQLWSVSSHLLLFGCNG